MAKKYNGAEEGVFARVPGLRLVEALFADNAREMFCVKDRRGRYVSVNGAFVARSGMKSRAAVLGKTARELFPPVLAAGYEQQDGEVLRTGRAIVNKLEMITNADGSTGWYLTRKEPVVDGRGEVVAIAVVSTDLERAVSGDGRYGALGGAIERIQREYARPLRMSALAREAGMSVTGFERRMREVVGVSPRRLLTQTRIEAAARMLGQSEATLLEVGQGCGFYDQSQFTRQFKAMTGVTPGEYRRVGVGSR